MAQSESLFFENPPFHSFIFEIRNRATLYLKQFNVRLDFGNNLRSHLRAHVYLDANRIHGQCGRVISELKSINKK